MVKYAGKVHTATLFTVLLEPYVIGSNPISPANIATLEKRPSHQSHKLKIVGSTPTVATNRGVAQW